MFISTFLFQTYSNEWEETWGEFDRQCQYQLAESPMLRCLAEGMTLFIFNNNNTLLMEFKMSSDLLKYILICVFQLLKVLHCLDKSDFKAVTEE